MGKVALCYCSTSLIMLLISYPGYTQVDVLTQHNDLARTGWNNQETALNQTNVKTGSFGKLFTLTLDDQVYAQQLVVSGVSIPSRGNKNVVFVCTVNNSVYAFDADDGTQYWNSNFTPPGFRVVNKGDMHSSVCGGVYYDFNNNIGIVGTPVIDKAANTMYFVTKIASIAGIDNHTFDSSIPQEEYTYTSTGFFQYLHAIDLSTGAEKANSPVQILASTPGTGDGSSGGVVSFDPRRQFNRTGLVLSRGIVYIAYASHCDWNPSHGWLLGYDASTLQQRIVYNATPNDGRGGIWMSGGAPAVDGSGSLYFTTGNSNNGGTIPDGSTLFTDLPGVSANRGESVVKVTPNKPDNTATSVSVSSYFTPSDYIIKNEDDLDFPIQVMLLPNTHMLLTGCKDDSLYIMDTTNLGGFNLTSNNVLQTIYVGSNGAEMHSSFAYFGGSNAQYVYQLSENTTLQAFPVGTNSLGAAIVNNNSTTWPNGPSGGFMSVSSNGSDISTGILWITHPEANSCGASPCHGILRAIKANDINTELWNSADNASDNLGDAGKMSCPTIANGKVYQANSVNQVMVYGLLSIPLPLDLINFTANNVNDQYVQLKWGTSGEASLDHFDVERSSNGIAFSTVKQIKAGASRNIEQYYSLADDNPVDGINYYRLKEVDLNGDIYYSPIVKVNFGTGTTPRISPNPANSYFTIAARLEAIREITLLDVSGKIIEHVLNENASSAITIACSNLAAGIYIVKIKTASQEYQKKLFKQ